MRIIKDPKFNQEFKVVLRFIALDSKSKAKIFKDELIAHVNDLTFMPYKYRKSIYFSDNNIRDYIFKGYVIPYHINTADKTLTILGIVKYKESLHP